MAKASKGKVRYLKDLFGIPQLIKVREMVRWVERFMTPEVVAKIDRFNSAIVNHKPDTGLIVPIAKKGYYDGCRKLDTELDLEMFVHITRVEPNAKYFALHRNKPVEERRVINLDELACDDNTVELKDGIWQRKREY